MAKGIKTGGRTKGTPNKSTTRVKNALLQAFDELGGVPSLVEWGRGNPDDFYKLWVKVLPVQVNEDPEYQNNSIQKIEIEVIGANSQDSTH